MEIHKENITTRAQRRARQINNGLYALAQAGVKVVNQMGRIPEHVSVALLDGIITVVPKPNSRETLNVKRLKGTGNAEMTSLGFNPDGADVYSLRMRGKDYRVRVAPKLDNLSPRDRVAAGDKGIEAYWERTCKNYEVPTEV